METKQEAIIGYAYVSGNGQLVVDTHPTDESHLLASATNDTQPLHTCRLYLSKLIPEEWRGRHGEFVITRSINDDGMVCGLQLVFTPSCS